MPSIRTAYAWLIAMGFLGVIGLPIIFGFGIYISWDALSTGAIITQVTGMLISVFSSMCGVVVLKQLEAQYLLNESADTAVEKEEEEEEEKRKRRKRNTRRLQIFFVIAVIIVFLDFFLYGFIANALFY